MTKQLHLYLIALGGLALALTIVFIGSAGDATAAPSLVTNGNFDTDAASWTAAANSSITWISTEDGDLNPASGAGTVARSSGGAGDGIASQCIDITASGAGNYQVAASYKQTPGGSGTQTASVDVTVYTDNACSAGAAAHPSGTLSANSGWLSYSGTINFVTTELSMKIDLVVHAVAQGDGVYFDKIALSNGALDTPTPTATASPTNTATPTNTPTVTNTPSATDTPTATNTPIPTDTPTATNTPRPTRTPTNTPIPTNTPPATNTSIPAPTDTPAVPAAADTPAEGPPPESSSDDTTNPDGGEAGAGTSPEGDLEGGSEGFPESGYGPQPHDNGGQADAIATLLFVVAIGLLGTGFVLQRRSRRDNG